MSVYILYLKYIYFQKAEDITSQPSTDTSEELEDCETADGNGQQGTGR